MDEDRWWHFRLGVFVILGIFWIFLSLLRLMWRHPLF